MRILSSLSSCWLLGHVVLITSVTANAPMNVQVTLRGKKYEIADVTTVGELQERVSDASGVDPSQQGRVLFDGKRLDPSETLMASGVSQGDQLNIVPGKTKKKSSATSAKSSSSSSAALSAAAAGAAPSSGGANSLEEMIKSMGGMGGGGNSLEEMVKSMGGGAGGAAPSMQESMEMMGDMMNSPIFKEYMNDPEKLEESRQMILNNPMLKSMMAGMPGMEELLSSPDAWRETMQAAASMYQSMDQEDLMKAMMGGAGGAGMPGGGMPPGLFDGMDNAQASSSALDELSEGED